MSDPREDVTQDDAALSALLDNSLASESAAELRGRLEREPALAARLAAMQRADRAVRDAYHDVVGEPLPQSVLDLLRAPLSSGATVVEMKARGARRALPSWFPQAAAAGIVLAIGLALGYGAGQLSSGASPRDLLAATGAVAAGSPLHEALESAPSGEPRSLAADVTVAARLTFRDIDGDWCREVSVSAAAASSNALACRRDGNWHVELVGAAAAGGDLYRPAAAAEAPFREAVDALIDGEPLEPDAERALLDSRWAGD